MGHHFTNINFLNVLFCTRPSRIIVVNRSQVTHVVTDIPVYVLPVQCAPSLKKHLINVWYTFLKQSALERDT